MRHISNRKGIRNGKKEWNNRIKREVETKVKCNSGEKKKILHSLRRSGGAEKRMNQHFRQWGKATTSSSRKEKKKTVDNRKIKGIYNESGERNSA